MENLPCDDVLKKCLKTLEVSDSELQTLLTCKEKGLIDFLLVDIRELFEYSERSIDGTDLLLPTSTIHQQMNILEKNRDNFILLYCRTGNRTSFMLSILQKMGFEKIAHLSEGIVGYSGSISKNASIPN